MLAIKAENAERGLVAARVGTGGDKLAKYDKNGRFYGVPPHIAALVKRAQKAARRYEGSRMIMGGSGNKKFDLNGQNVKTKLPRLVRSSLGCNAAWYAVSSVTLVAKTTRLY